MLPFSPYTDADTIRALYQNPNNTLLLVDTAMNTGGTPSIVSGGSVFGNTPVLRTEDVLGYGEIEGEIELDNTGQN